ncbi:helix-turn-helix domain-containing protein [Bradyrhizobium sp. B120]
MAGEWRPALFVTKTAVAREYGVSRETVHRYLRVSAVLRTSTIKE